MIWIVLAVYALIVVLTFRALLRVWYRAFGTFDGTTICLSALYSLVFLSGWIILLTTWSEGRPRRDHKLLKRFIGVSD